VLLFDEALSDKTVVLCFADFKSKIDLTINLLNLIGVSVLHQKFSSATQN